MGYQEDLLAKCTTLPTGVYCDGTASFRCITYITEPFIRACIQAIFPKFSHGPGTRRTQR